MQCQGEFSFSESGDQDGYTQWLKTSGDFVLAFSKPSKDRVIVFPADGSSNYDSAIDSRTLDVHIGRVRAKIEENPRVPKSILTVPGVGYKLVAEATQ